MWVLVSDLVLLNRVRGGIGSLRQKVNNPYSSQLSLFHGATLTLSYGCVTGAHHVGANSANPCHPEVARESRRTDQQAPYLRYGL